MFMCCSGRRHIEPFHTHTHHNRQKNAVRRNVNMIKFHFEVFNESEENVMQTMIDANSRLFSAKKNVLILSQLTRISLASPRGGWLIH